MRYLLDELYVYEEDYSGALCPIQNEGNVSLLGEHRLVAPVSTEEMRMMHNAISSELRSVKSDVGIVMASALCDMKNLIVSGGRQPPSSNSTLFSLN